MDESMDESMNESMDEAMDESMDQSMRITGKSKWHGSGTDLGRIARRIATAAAATTCCEYTEWMCVYLY